MTTKLFDGEDRRELVRSTRLWKSRSIFYDLLDYGLKSSYAIKTRVMHSKLELQEMFRRYLNRREDATNRTGQNTRAVPETFVSTAKILRVNGWQWREMPKQRWQDSILSSLSKSINERIQISSRGPKLKNIRQLEQVTREDPHNGHCHRETTLIRWR